VLSRIASALVLCLPAYFFSDTPAWALATVSIAIVATIVGIALVLGASRARTAQPAGAEEYRMRPAAAGRYLALMFATHALITTAQTPIARGSLHSIRLRFRRPALERAAV
jgi:hypothetical protein